MHNTTETRMNKNEREKHEVYGEVEKWRVSGGKNHINFRVEIDLAGVCCVHCNGSTIG